MKIYYPSPFRRALMVFATTAVFISWLPAQSVSENRRDRIAPQVEELRERLKLTPDQVERARPVLQREAQQMRDLLRDFDRDSASMREKRKLAREVKRVREDADKQLQGILTSAQIEELRRIREERRKQLRTRGQGDA